MGQYAGSVVIASSLPVLKRYPLSRNARPKEFRTGHASWHAVHLSPYLRANAGIVDADVVWTNVACADVVRPDVAYAGRANPAAATPRVATNRNGRRVIVPAVVVQAIASELNSETAILGVERSGTGVAIYEPGEKPTCLPGRFH